MQIKIKVFYKLILSFWVCSARHAQSTQNKKFPYLCNISRKTWRMMFFLPADKHKSFIQVASATLGVPNQACSSTQNTKFAFSDNISRKTLSMNIKGFYKLMLSFQVYVARHAQITTNNKFDISLQYLNKEVSDEVDFFACR